MARTRLELREVFKDVLGGPDSHVYFSPPNNMQMEYPCIIYDLSDVLHNHANNKVYKADVRYSFTLIVQRIEEADEFLKKIEQLPQCAMDRHYVADGLQHFTYAIFW